MKYDIYHARLWKDIINNSAVLHSTLHSYSPKCFRKGSSWRLSNFLLGRTSFKINFGTRRFWEMRAVIKYNNSSLTIFYRFFSVHDDAAADLAEPKPAKVYPSHPDCHEVCSSAKWRLFCPLRPTRFFAKSASIRKTSVSSTFYRKDELGWIITEFLQYAKEFHSMWWLCCNLVSVRALLRPPSKINMARELEDEDHWIEHVCREKIRW